MLACAASPLQAADGHWCAPPRQLRLTAADDFRRGLSQWRIEAQDARATVQAADGVLDIQTPAGLSLWWKPALQGDYELRFTAVALPAPESAGALAGRVSDLNMFWNATEADGREPAPRSGAFAGYDSLRLYYAGFGANGNRTTRLRHYPGDGSRTLRDGWADAADAEPGDRKGAMTAATQLRAGQPLRIAVVSRVPTPADRVHLRWTIDDRTLFTLADTQPLLRGWFAVRTTASRLQLRDFQIFHCLAP